MAICTECGFPKDDSEFDRTPHKQRLKSRCRECVKRKLAASSRAWQLRNPQKFRDGVYKSRYGIDFEGLWQAQKGACALCHEPLMRGGKTPMSVCVDHDRECCPGETSCGKCVRGLIHRRCNLILGYSGDDPDVLRGLIGYLERWMSRAGAGGVT